MKHFKVGVLVYVTASILTMILSVDGWDIFATPLSILGIKENTKQHFAGFMLIQAMTISVLYYDRIIQPVLGVTAVLALTFIGLFNVIDYPEVHNISAIYFFLVQPIIFFVEYYREKGIESFLKGVILVLLIGLLGTGVMSIPEFEVTSYLLLILFL